MTEFNAETIAKNARQKGKKIVLVTGVFDGLHSEHKNFLQAAKNAGDVLLVGIERDIRVKELKGEDRPKFSQDARLRALTDFVDSVHGEVVADCVFLLPEAFNKPEHYKALIALLKPDILAVSSHSPHQDKKRVILEEFGGVVQVVHQHNPAVSTTLLLHAQRN